MSAIRRAYSVSSSPHCSRHKRLSRADIRYGSFHWSPLVLGRLFPVLCTVFVWLMDTLWETKIPLRAQGVTSDSRLHTRLHGGNRTTGKSYRCSSKGGYCASLPVVAGGVSSEPLDPAIQKRLRTTGSHAQRCAQRIS